MSFESSAETFLRGCQVDHVNMERGEWYRRRMYGINKLRIIQKIPDNGYKNASAHGSPPRSGVARKGANLHHKHGAGSRGTGRTLGSGAGLCALGVGEEGVDGAVARTAGSES